MLINHYDINGIPSLVMSKQIFIECYGCGSVNATLIYEPKYRGLRGNCPSCGGNWPES